jgi:hypothetical protein
MKTLTKLVLAAAFAAVSLAPQAMAGSCDAMRTDFNNWFRTQRSGPEVHSIGLSMVTNRSNALYVGNSDGVGDHAVLKMTLPGFRAKLSLPGLPNSYLTSRSPQASGRPVPPQFNWWCYTKCLQNGGNPEDCSFMCNGLPRPQ